MKRILRLLFPLLCAVAFAQVPVTPVIQPHMTFLNNSGLACAGCSLSTFAAGTTTPLPTYTDSTGTSQNTNPIVLGADGGANIWLSTSAYKLVLRDTLGTMVFSVDNVSTDGGLSVCDAVSAIQIANSAGTGLTCDATITISTVNHTINVGTLGAGHVTIAALGTPTSWTFDTTSPNTALTSLGGVPFAYPGAGIPNSTGSAWGTSYSASNLIPASFVSTLNQNTTGTASNLSGTPALPNGTTATTQTAGDNTTKIATDAFVQAAIGTSARTCTTGTTWVCFQVLPGGTIEEEGVAGPVPTGADTASLSITFPHAFTTTANLTFIAFPDNCADACSGKNPISLSGTGASSLTTTGNTISASGIVPTGGGGASINNTVYVHWQAKGN